jgi:hypothetical protein
VIRTILIAGTLVTTSNGDIPIEKITKGQFILTRAGWRKVIWSGINKASATVYRVDFSDGKSIVGTGNHPIFIQGKGFVSIDALRYGDIITTKENILWRLTRSSSMASSSGDTRKLAALLPEGITVRAETIASKGLASCIKRFGKAITDPFQKVVTFITETSIRSIMTSPILNVYPLSTISLNMERNIYRGKNTWQRSGQWLRNGIGQKQAGSGTRNMVKIAGKIASLYPLPAITAGKSTSLFSIENTITAHQFVDQQPGVTRIKMMFKRLVRYVESLLVSIVMKIKKLAHVYVVQVCAVHALNNPQPVYDLEIDGQHEFLANGVLVHNSFDTAKYGLTNEGNVNEKKKQQKQGQPVQAYKYF